MLNVSDNRGATKSFTFTLFLDDVISSSDDSFVEFLETSSEKVDNHCISFKNEDWELATQAVSPKINSLESPEKTVTFGRKLSLRIESPTFNDNSNCKQNERKKKKTFLSICHMESENDDKSSLECNSATFSLSPEPLYPNAHQRQSLFSHQNNLHILNNNKISSSKLQTKNIKISGAMLKNSLKNKHFDRVLKKLKRISENCKMPISAY